LEIADEPPVPCTPMPRLAVDLGDGRRLLDADLVPVGVQLLGGDSGRPGVVALAEFNVLGDTVTQPSG
jgi:hypothetical protein